VIANYAVSSENGEEFMVNDIGRLGAVGALGPFIVGSGEQIADQLQEWVEETDVDGFNVAYAITPGTCEDIVVHVIPVLREWGAYPASYAPDHCARSFTAEVTVPPSSTKAQSSESAVPGRPH
jgi:hypothetical protein